MTVAVAGTTLLLRSTVAALTEARLKMMAAAAEKRVFMVALLGFGPETIFRVPMPRF